MNLRQMADQLVRLDQEHAELRCELFQNAGLHPGVEVESDLPLESQEQLEEIMNRRLELQREVHRMRKEQENG